MPIVNFTPSAKPDIQPNLPKVSPKEYKSPAKDTKVIPVDRLLAYVSGAEWIVDYYSQYTTKSNDLREVDPNEHPVYQQYTLIKNYALKVTSSLDSSYEPETAISKVIGTSNMYSFIVPNVNDYFVSDAGESRKGLFKITTVERKSFNLESVYEINYDLIGYVDTGASVALYEDLASKVIKTFYFDTQRFKEGLYPLVLEETRQRIIDYTIEYKSLCKYYFNLFFNRKYMTLVLPGQEFSCYDPFLVNYISKIVEVEVVPEMHMLKMLSTENDVYIKQDQFWSMMLNRDINMLDHINTQMGLATKSAFNNNSYVHAFKYTNIDYMVYPLNDSLIGHIPDTSTRIGLIPEPKFVSYTFTELYETKNIAGLLSSSIYIEYVKDTAVYPLFYNILESNHYVLSHRFYSQSSDMSVIEILAKDFIKRNNIDMDMLEFALSNYKVLSRLEQFYYGPILMTLLKEVIRNSHI